MVRVVVLAAFAGAVVSAADVDCELSDWKPQECDTSTHTQVFERTVTKEVSGNGRACGALTETRPCNPVDCRLSAWSPWSACQDDGFSVRTRTVLTEPQFGGRNCQPTTDRVLCGQAAEQRRLAGAVEFPSGLKSTANSDSFHMSPIRVVQARVQSDKPKWDADNGAFGSTYYTDFEGSFRGLLDTVNTASVEGALMYVQAEGINEAVRGTTERCTRKNKMKYVVFYDMVIAQTNETLALFNAEYGTYLAMDGGQCTPTSGTGDTAVYPDECYLFNGDKTHPIVGPFVGGEARDTDERAPYPNTWWFSFPNSCPLQKWGSAKTDACRSSTRTGLCNYDTKPDGVKCTYNYRVLGWIPIDDLVGITSMKNAAGATYANFSQFCNDGGVEFKGTTNNTWIDGIDFWKNPRDSSANAARATKLVSMYNDAIAGSVSLTQVSSTDFANFKALPSVSTLTAANPPCYKHIKSCATAKYGCKRSLYGQICTECSDASDGCVVAPSSFTFPAIAKATLAPTTTAPTPTTATPSTDTSTIDTPTADTTTAPTPSTSTKSDTAATPSTNTGSAAMATSVASLTTVAIAFVLSCQL